MLHFIYFFIYHKPAIYPHRLPYPHPVVTLGVEKDTEIKFLLQFLNKPTSHPNLPHQMGHCAGNSVFAIPKNAFIHTPWSKCILELAQKNPPRILPLGGITRRLSTQQNPHLTGTCPTWHPRTSYGVVPADRGYPWDGPAPALLEEACLRTVRAI